ncbi:MAG: hypothetical protein ABI608_02740, partial [Rhizomicrobium sp.]
YHEAAKAMLLSGKKGNQLSRASWRLVAIHAIELYLNALLLHFGQNPSEIRGLQHNMGSRTERAIAKGLTLRKRTVSHLANIGMNREYLTVRYSPEPTATLSQINRLNATLEELAEKAAFLIAG